MSTRITLVGGGVWLPRLVTALHEAHLPPLRLTVLARRAARLQRIVEACPTSPRLTIHGTTDPQAAFDGARVVVLLLRVGGQAARSHDERFPTRWGRVGDEGLGLGGLANAWRTLPVLQPMAATILRHAAPGVQVIDMVAPLGITTRALRADGLQAVGLCELPAVTEAQLGAADRSTPLHHAGFNHAGWFWSDTPGDPHLARHALQAGLADETLLAEHDAVPLHYIPDVLRPGWGRRLGRPPKQPGRAQALARMGHEMLQTWERGGTWQGERATPWFDLALAPALRALLGGDPWIGWANLPEPHDPVVIEGRAHWEADGIRFEPEPAPDRLRPFLDAQRRWEEAGYRAARTRDPHALLPALEALGLPARDHEAVIDAITSPWETTP